MVTLSQPLVRRIPITLRIRGLVARRLDINTSSFCQLSNLVNDSNSNNYQQNISIMKFLHSLILLGTAAATPIEHRQTSESFKFYCRVLPNLIAPNDFLQNEPLVADGGKFFLGGDTSSSNPQNPTVLIGSPNACSLDVGVPDGQRVYVSHDLSVGYTSPHSAMKPEGAVDCLDVDRDANPGAQTLTLWSTAFGANGFMACPVDGRWELFAQQWSGPNAYGNSMRCVWMDLICQYYLDNSDPSACSY
jgi:hypothetical protein